MLLWTGLKDTAWKKIMLISFLILVWLAVIIQCSTGSDVLKWRSFYATHDAAWKAHYREVFDHGIREVLCCLGRAKYLYDIYLFLHLVTNMIIHLLEILTLFIISLGVSWKKMKFILLQDY